MKKYVVLGGILITSMLSGCFFLNETITCTKQDKVSGMDSDQKVKVVLKSKKIQTIDMNIAIDMSKQTDGMIGVAKSVLSSTYDPMKAGGIETSVKEKDKKINVNVNMDFEKASKKSLQNVDPNFANSKDKKIDTDEFIKSMEQEGYKCKK